MKIRHIDNSATPLGFDAAMKLARATAGEELGDNMLLSWYDRDLESPRGASECHEGCPVKGYWDTHSGGFIIMRRTLTAPLLRGLLLLHMIMVIIYNIISFNFFKYKPHDTPAPTVERPDHNHTVYLACLSASRYANGIPGNCLGPLLRDEGGGR